MCQFNWKMVITTWMWFRIRRFRKDFSVCIVNWPVINYFPPRLEKNTLEAPIEGPSWTLRYRIDVMFEGLQGDLNWSPIMPSGVSLSGKWCHFPTLVIRPQLKFCSRQSERFTPLGLMEPPPWISWYLTYSRDVREVLNEALLWWSL